MCYSALIKAQLKKLEIEFRAKADLDSFGRLFELRLDHPELKVPFGLDRYFLLSEDPREQKLAPLVKQHLENEKTRAAAELAATEAELKALRAGKSTAAATKKKIEVRERRRVKLQQRLAHSLEQISPLDDRIYPGSFAPVLIEREGERLLVPMRYRVRMPSGAEIPSKYNVFNARRDSLQQAATWKALFARTHAIFPFVRFFEWVERNGGKHEIAFSPEKRSLMWAAALYSPPRSKEILPYASFAMVTDEPPAEVAAAGHDRCPVFLQESVIESWLQPQKKTPEFLLSLLDQKEKTFYLHNLVA